MNTHISYWQLYYSLLEERPLKQWQIKMSADCFSKSVGSLPRNHVNISRTILFRNLHFSLYNAHRLGYEIFSFYIRKLWCYGYLDTTLQGLQHLYIFILKSHLTPKRSLKMQIFTEHFLYKIILSLIFRNVCLNSCYAYTHTHTQLRKHTQ